MCTAMKLIQKDYKKKLEIIIFKIFPFLRQPQTTISVMVCGVGSAIMVFFVCDIVYHTPAVVIIVPTPGVR